MSVAVRAGAVIAALLLARAPAAAQGAPTVIPVASLAAVLADTSPPAGPYLLTRWDRFPGVLVFDMADFAAQDRTFSRLAFFLEKKGTRGRLLTNDELAGMHGWNAHDYNGNGLAAFFEAARHAGFPLNAEEVALRDLALREGIITLSRGSYRPGEGSLLSISRASTRPERRFLLLHESFHGIFFESVDYRRLCFDLWESLTDGEQEFFVQLFALLGYESSDRALCVNELQAYLMQQPVRLVPEYFARTLKRFEDAGLPPIDGARLQEMARTLGGFLSQRFGVEPGGTLAARPAGTGP
jgi:hypothetical protein